MSITHFLTLYIVSIRNFLTLYAINICGAWARELARHAVEVLQRLRQDPAAVALHEDARALVRAHLPGPQFDAVNIVNKILLTLYSVK